MQVTVSRKIKQHISHTVINLNSLLNHKKRFTLPAFTFNLKY